MNGPSKYKIVSKTESSCLSFIINDFNRIIGTLSDVSNYNLKLKSLQDIDYLADISEGELELLIDLIHKKRYIDNEYIITQNEDLHKFFILYKGNIKMMQKNEEEEEEFISLKSTTGIILVRHYRLFIWF